MNVDERKRNWNSENPNSKEKEDERWSNKIHDEDSFNVQNQNEAFPVVANCKYFFAKVVLSTIFLFYLFSI